MSRLLERVKKNSGAELSVYVDKRMIPRDVAATLAAHGTAETEGPAQGMTPISSTHPELLGKLLSGEFLAGVQDEIYAARDRDGVEYGIFAFPLFDFAGRQIGVIRPAGQARRLTPSPDSQSVPWKQNVEVLAS